jgi:hypothetical protein
VYHRNGTYVGSVTNPAAWTHLGTVSTTSAGTGQPTPVALGGWTIPAGAVYGLYIAAAGEPIRYSSAALTPTMPVRNNDLSIHIDNGIAVDGLFAANTTFGPARGWNGTIYYTAHGTVATGSCCLPDGTCEVRSQFWCNAEDGVYHGDGTNCATTPPGGCPPPSIGACCLAGGACLDLWAGDCAAQDGIYRGDGSNCATVPACPLTLSTGYTATLSFAAPGGPSMGNLFDIESTNIDGLTITGWAVHTRHPFGTPVVVQVWLKEGTHVGHHTNAAAWTLLGEHTTLSAGSGKPTIAEFGQVFIPSGQVYGARVGISEGQINYYSADQTNANPIFANADLTIDLSSGRAQNTLFTGGNTPRGWSGTVYYQPGNTAALGACCLPDASCAALTEFQCALQSGTYQGDGSNCATIPPCRLPGACCLQDGTCEILSHSECASAGGTYQGDDTNCSSHPCPPAGACCLPDGHCMNVALAGCMVHGGNFQGEWTTCFSTDCTVPLLFRNGDILTHEGFGFRGSDISRASSSSLGSSVTLSGAGPHFRMADNFTVTDAEGWTIQSVFVYGYVTGTYPFLPPPSPFSDINVNIWNGIPGEPGSSIVGTSTDLQATGFTGVYRIASGGAANNTDRPIMYNRVGFNNLHLPAGDYWVDYQYTNVVGSAFSSYVMDVDPFGIQFTPLGNSRQLTTAGWNLTAIAPNDDPVDVPFAITGTVGGAPCYANCDHSTTPPVLNVEDFVCFINEFAQGQLLPTAQQITHYANCDGSTTEPVLNVEDFICFINEFSQGCP